MENRVDQILSWYESDNPGVLKNLHWMMNTGALAGTGKFVILPVDQGFEHGPARSFAKNPAGYDPQLGMSGEGYGPGFNQGVPCLYNFVYDDPMSGHYQYTPISP